MQRGDLRPPFHFRFAAIFSPPRPVWAAASSEAVQVEPVRAHAHLVAADVDRAVAAAACAAAAVAAPAAPVAAAAAAPAVGSDSRGSAVAAADHRVGHPGQSARDARLAAVAVPQAAAVAAPVSILLQVRARPEHGQCVIVEAYRAITRRGGLRLRILCRRRAPGPFHSSRAR
jgi:hypothetical protein